MSKLIAYIFFKIIFFFNFLYYFFLKKNFLVYLYSYLRNSSYKTLFIKKKKAIFFCPNDICLWRVKTFFSKEPETLKFIESFPNKKNIVFWDIGSNIGIYSIYAALIKSKIRVYSFEPSFNNLNILAENISINRLCNKITICPLALNFTKDKAVLFSEPGNIEGSAHNNIKNNFAGLEKKIYKTIGFNGDFFVENKIAKYPDFIKCDIDGLENYILSKFKKILNNKRLKQILIECETKNSLKKVNGLLKAYDFKIYNIEIENKKQINFLFKR